MGNRTPAVAVRASNPNHYPTSENGTVRGELPVSKEALVMHHFVKKKIVLITVKC